MGTSRLLLVARAISLLISTSAAMMPLAIAGEPDLALSRTLTKVLPNVAARLASRAVAERVGVAVELTMPYANDIAALKFRYALPREDYVTVLKAVFALDLRKLSAEEAGRAWYALTFIVSKQNIREVVPSLVPYLRSGTDKDRLEIAQALAALHVDSAVPDIVPLLQSPERYVRQEVLPLLVKMQAPQVVPTLIARLADVDHLKRYDAIQDLVQADARSATQEIAKLLEDPDENNRYWALNALFKLGAGPHVPAIRKLLATTKSRNTEGYAVAVLAGLGDPDAIARAIRALTSSDPNNLDAFTPLVKTHATAIIPAVIAALEQRKPFGDFANNINARARMIHLLPRLGTVEARQAVPVLRTYLKSGSDSMLRDAAAEVLGFLRAREAADDLAALIDPKLMKDSFARCSAGVALARVGDPRTRPRLIALAADPKCGYRTRIIAEMNAFLDPTRWQTLEGTRVRDERPLPIEDAVDALRRETGLAIELRDHRAADSSKTQPFSAWGGAGGPGESALRALEGLAQRTGTAERPFTFQFRGDVIAILPVADAVDWWRQHLLAP